MTKKIQPPFEAGDIVRIIPHSPGCGGIGAEFVRVDLEIQMCERAAVEPEVVWDVDLVGCPYLIIHPIDEYTLEPVRLLRDQVI